VGLTWLPNGWDGKTSFIVSTIPFVKKFLNTTSQIQNFMKTSRHSKQLSIEDELTSLRGDSLANPLAQQDLEKEQKTNATYGRRCLESFGKFPRATLWAKTFADFLIGQGDWYSSKCALTWKLKATKSHRIYFQLRVKTHPTEEIEFGLLPTVTSQTRERTLEECQNRQKKYGGEKRALYLDHFAAMGLLPTPLTNDWKGSAGPSENWKGDSDLTVQIHKRTNQTPGKTSQLNPLFVEEMMGFPKNWTVSPFQSGEKKV
jgi:hypothetical protein